MSLSEEGEKHLRDRAIRKHRSISKEIEHLVNLAEERDKWNEERVFRISKEDKEELKNLIKQSVHKT